MTSLLSICTSNKHLAKLYSTHTHYHEGDSGIDLFFPEDVVFDKPGDKKIIDLQISCEMKTSKGRGTSYYLYPRSSIAKTDLQLVNSVGIIDAEYRGTIKVALRRVSGTTDKQAIIKAGERLVQICGPTLEPIKLQVVQSLTSSGRGSGGLGSTGV